MIGQFSWRRCPPWWARCSWPVLRGRETPLPDPAGHRPSPVLQPDQRVLNDLQRTSRSCGRMIRLLAHPLPPLPPSNCLSFSVFLCVGGLAYWRERGKGGRARSQIIRPRKSLALYKSFNTLWTRPSYVHISSLLECQVQKRKFAPLSHMHSYTPIQCCKSGFWILCFFDTPGISFSGSRISNPLRAC
jgi:hypothetical protein